MKKEMAFSRQSKSAREAIARDEVHGQSPLEGAARIYGQRWSTPILISLYR